MALSNSSADGEPARWEGNDLILRVRVQPRASRNEFAGRLGDAIKIRLTAPPVEGQANTALCEFLAKSFGVARSQVILLSGETGRSKRLRIAAPARLPPELNAPRPTRC